MTEKCQQQRVVDQVDERYELLEHVGRGAYMEVWKARARNSDVPIQEVSVRISIDSFIGSYLDELRERLEQLDRSTQLQRRAKPQPWLSHPIKHGTANSYGERRIVTVQTWMDGVPLDRKFATRERSPRHERLYDGFQLAQKGTAVTEWHQTNGLVHRDMKPGNCAVNPEGRLGVFDRDSTVEEGYRASIVDGTPIYMAPETARREPVDARTDLHAVGIMVWEWLYGRTSLNLHSQSKNEIILRKVSGHTCSDSNLSIRELIRERLYPGNFNPEYADTVERLEKWLMAVLRFDRQRRPLPAEAQAILSGGLENLKDYHGPIAAAPEPIECPAIPRTGDIITLHGFEIEIAEGWNSITRPIDPIKGMLVGDPEQKVELISHGRGTEIHSNPKAKTLNHPKAPRFHGPLIDMVEGKEPSPGLKLRSYELWFIPKGEPLRDDPIYALRENDPKRIKGHYQAMQKIAGTLLELMNDYGVLPVDILENLITKEGAIIGHKFFWEATPDREKHTIKALRTLAKMIDKSLWGVFGNQSRYLNNLPDDIRPYAEHLINWINEDHPDLKTALENLLSSPKAR